MRQLLALQRQRIAPWRGWSRRSRLAPAPALLGRGARGPRRRDGSERDLGGGIVLSWGRRRAGRRRVRDDRRPAHGAQSEAGRREIRAALEPPTSRARSPRRCRQPSKAEREAHETKYQLLALENVPHYDTAIETWRRHHRQRALSSRPGGRGRRRLDLQRRHAERGVRAAFPDRRLLGRARAHAAPGDHRLSTPPRPRPWRAPSSPACARAWKAG